jgi:hypothetical protein
MINLNAAHIQNPLSIEPKHLTLPFKSNFSTVMLLQTKRAREIWKEAIFA